MVTQTTLTPRKNARRNANNLYLSELRISKTLLLFTVREGLRKKNS